MRATTREANAVASGERGRRWRFAWHDVVPRSRIDCAAARRAVSLRLDGELPSSELLPLQRHLASCARCASFAATCATIRSVLSATLESCADDELARRWA